MQSVLQRGHQDHFLPDDFPLESIPGPPFSKKLKRLRSMGTVRMFFFFLQNNGAPSIMWRRGDGQFTFWTLNVQKHVSCIPLCVSGEHGQSEVSMSVVFVPVSRDLLYVYYRETVQICQPAVIGARSSSSDSSPIWLKKKKRNVAFLLYFKRCFNFSDMIWSDVNSSPLHLNISVF